MHEFIEIKTTIGMHLSESIFHFQFTSCIGRSLSYSALTRFSGSNRSRISPQSRERQCKVPKKCSMVAKRARRQHIGCKQARLGKLSAHSVPVSQCRAKLSITPRTQIRYLWAITSLAVVGAPTPAVVTRAADA